MKFERKTYFFNNQTQSSSGQANQNTFLPTKHAAKIVVERIFVPSTNNAGVAVSLGPGQKQTIAAGGSVILNVNSNDTEECTVYMWKFITTTHPTDEIAFECKIYEHFKDNRI